MPYKDLEARRAYGRGWMNRNSDRAREAMRRWRESHRDIDRANKREGYRLNPEAARARNEAYRKAHPDVERVRRHNRRAREVASPGRHSAAEWRALVEEYGGCCAYCGAQTVMTQDHRVPLKRGGSNDIANIFPACLPCNLRKHTLTEREYRVRLANERWRSTDFDVVDWWAAREIEWVS